MSKKLVNPNTTARQGGDMQVNNTFGDEKLIAEIQAYIDKNYIEQSNTNKTLSLDECNDLVSHSLKLNLLEAESKKPLESKAAIGCSCCSEDAGFDYLQPQSIKKQSDLEDDSFDIFEPSEGIPESLEEMLKTKQESFQNILMHHIAERNLSNKTVYQRANISSKFFSKIICNKNYVPKKKNVMALAIGLKLNMKEAEDFMAAAGYAFSRSEKVDLIIKFFILHEEYDMGKIQAALYELTGETLGNLID